MRLPRLPLALALAFLATGPLAAEPVRPEPVRLAAPAFGVTAEVEVRDLPRPEAEAAARLALEEIFAFSRLTDPDSRLPGGVGALNGAAGREDPLPLAEGVAELLLRGLQICAWSSGAHGPLGGELYRLWGQDGLPDPTDLRWAVASADCSRLGLAGGETPVATLAEGSRIDGSWMERGLAIDRAARRLAERGVTNAWLEIGPVYRGLGPGPDGRGWLLSLPPVPGGREPIDELWLRDQALAVVRQAPDDGVSRSGVPRSGVPRSGVPGPPLIDQRTGVPARGVVAVVVVAGEAWDAEALAASLFIFSLREGQLRLGGYSPRPSILWLLGDGAAAPLQSTYRWTELDRVPRR